ncbi:P-loop containing nucleoside triphosphate hydrolase protein [Chytriomyces sp. MP71]|nr:P-loop containing nucleoside triphosphate hydrolase protein [Chytriomyces sp. MP71]
MATIESLALQHIVRCFNEINMEQRRKGPVVIGISGPQGCGKTTLTRNLISSLKMRHNLNAICLSLDDLYLTFDDQNKLRQDNITNPLLEFRGNPGTHDLKLGVSIFRAFQSGSGCARLPRYDKGLNSGRGDRMQERDWTPVAELPDIVLFEGWCLGFRPVLDSEVISSQVFVPQFEQDFVGYSVDNLIQVQRNLSQLEQELYGFIDAFVLIIAQDISWVYEWRQQQEDSMRKILKNDNAGLTQNQLREFISRFIPQYLIGLPRLRQIGFFDSEKVGRQLNIIVNKDRQVEETLLI